MWSSPTPSAKITCNTRGKLERGEFVQLQKGESVRVIRKANLHYDHEFGDYSERHFCVVYSRYGLVLVCVEDVQDGIY